jgi:hypothetical protein
VSSRRPHLETFPPFRREPVGRATDRADFGMDNRRRREHGRKGETPK